MQKQAVRIVTWNIEKGKRWAMLEQCLQHEAIRTADVLCLNEVDEGMARSGNRRIGHEIGERLGMQVIFGQAFKEFTKGVGEELVVPLENTTAIQGNATLSRLPILESRNLLLPACFDHSKRIEKRSGNRHALIVRLDAGQGRVLTVANAHLEVFGTSRCRAVQMKFMIQNVPAGPAIVAGDFNTNTFSRGAAHHTLYALGLLMFGDAKSRVMDPASFEPLFNELTAAGFSWKPFNDALPTCSIDLATLEDRVYAPGFIKNRVLAKARHLDLRLDFICARGLAAVSPGRTITDLPCQPSDHLPITCDVTF